MNNCSLDQTIELLDSLIFSRDNPDKELAEMIVNHAKIPFFRIDRAERLLIDVLGIETRKVCENIYLVEKIINPHVNYLSPGDYVIAPRKLDETFTQKDQKIEDYLYVLKINEDACKLQKEKIELNLRGKKRTSFNEGDWKYLKLENFSYFQANDGLIAENLIIDLRCNSGGIIADMKAVFERIFDSKIKMFQNLSTGVVDFRTAPAKKRKNVYIIVDKTTCSSAEIFTGLGKIFHDAILVGTKMYGKNMICKRKVIGDIVIHVPYKEYSINGKSILEIAPDYLVDNVCEYNEEEIMNFCQELKKSHSFEN